MAFRPYVDLQSPINVVEDELIKSLQNSIQKALQKAPLTLRVGEKRLRMEEIAENQQEKPPPPSSDLLGITKYDIYTYKYQIEHLTEELHNANEQIRGYKQIIEVSEYTNDKEIDIELKKSLEFKKTNNNSTNDNSRGKTSLY